MDYSTGKGGKVKGVRIGIRKYDGEINNTKKTKNKTTHTTKNTTYRNNKKVQSFGKSLGVIP
jgi:hypothetical protein